MAQLIPWILPLFVVFWLGFRFLQIPHFTPRTAVIRAIVAALCAWLLCMFRTDWTSTIPISIWWVIAALAGSLVAFALWPREAGSSAAGSTVVDRGSSAAGRGSPATGDDNQVT